MTDVFERRTYVEKIEVRSEGDTVTAAGYAAVFNRYSQNLGGFVERVAPGAFAQTVKQQDVVALFNHDPNHILGRASARTLTLEEDAVGLRYEVNLPNTTAGRDLAENLRNGNVIGSSFGFRTIDDEWGETEQGFPLRTLKSTSLRDVGPVTFPAYTDSTAALRSLAEKRHLDLDVLVAAANCGELRALIVPDGDSTSGTDDDGRETRTVSRPRFSWLYS